MRVSIALFTADLRVHDNPVLVAALKDAEHVVPLFVVDDGIRRAGFAVPNRAAFLADGLADLDTALRARGGKLVIRVGDVVEETCRVAAETGAGTVHIAGGVSRYAARREDRLRSELAGERCELRVHDASVTAVPPGALVPAGKDHFAVFTPYFHRWERVAVRGVLPAPDAVAVPAVRSAGPPCAQSLASGPVSPCLPVGGESEGRRKLASWLAGPLVHYADRHDDLAADATSRLSPYLHFGCLSPTELLHRTREHDGPGRTPLSASWPGGTSTTRSWPRAPTRPTVITAPGATAGAGMRRRSRPGGRASRVTRSWTRRCGSFGTRVGCRAGPAC